MANFTDQSDMDASTSRKIQRWGGFASFLLAASFIIAPLIYLTGNLRDALGPLSYDLADFMFGPLWAASLVISILSLRQRLGDHAPRRMSLSLKSAILSAGLMVVVACIRSANRHYHILHPELNLENSIEVLVVWTTLVAGLTGAGFHFLGWTLILLGSAGQASRRLPIILNALYLVAGIVSLFVYLLPDLEGFVAMLGIVVSIWQGVLLWQADQLEATR